MQVVAHRGASGPHPENTLQAFEAAVLAGADALECDVRLTRDGVLVCVHDRRVDRVSDGRGVVSTLELAQLAEMDFASWKDSGTDAPDRDAGRVLTLERLLQLVVDCGRHVQLHVETKHPTRYGALVEVALVDLLERYGLHAPVDRDSAPVAVLSYASTSLRRVRGMAPRLPTVLNMDRVPLRLRDGVLPRHVWAAGLWLDLVREQPWFVDRIHRSGRRVHVFTADAPDDVQLLQDLGVDAVITNDPERVLAQLRG